MFDREGDILRKDDPPRRPVVRRSWFIHWSEPDFFSLRGAFVRFSVVETISDASFSWYLRINRTILDDFSRNVCGYRDDMERK